MKYVVEGRLPTPAEYRGLIASVGWTSVMNLDVAKRALANSVAGVTACLPDGTAIGMGRIVGDGAIYYYIQDVVVAPEYQRHGIGSALLTGLFDYVRENAPEQSFVGLFSVPDAIGFYKRFTLEARDLVGLFTVKEIIVSS